MKTPKALERQIHRIYELLEGSQGEVTWDDHIRDPDNPRQFRQIDITIRRNGKLTLVECRLSKRRQDVKWVEELIGRRKSLGAQTIIAVASAGFTIGARKKAARYRVRLRDLRQLNDDEVQSWSGQVKMTLYYYRYSRVYLAIGFDRSSVANLGAAAFSLDLRSLPVMQSAFGAAARQLDEAKLLVRDDSRKIRIGVRIRPEGARLRGEPISEIMLEATVRLVARRLTSPGVFKFGKPAKPPAQREVTVEQFTPKGTSVVHDGERLAIDLDLSSLKLPRLSQIRYLRVTHSEERTHESFAITDPEALRVTGRIKARVFTCR